MGSVRWHAGPGLALDATLRTTFFIHKKIPIIDFPVISMSNWSHRQPIGTLWWWWLTTSGGGFSISWIPKWAARPSWEPDCGILVIF